VVNRAKLAALKTVYRHTGEEVAGRTTACDHEGRLFASPMADSNDGLGAPLLRQTSHGIPSSTSGMRMAQLKDIRMPKAEVGFAIASHYLSAGRRAAGPLRS
jgi:hypothetical protein